ATDWNGPRKSGLPDLRTFVRRSRVNPRSVSAAHRNAIKCTQIAQTYLRTLRCARDTRARRTNLRVQKNGAEEGSLFPACSLQGAVQLQRVVRIRESKSGVCPHASRRREARTSWRAFA